VAPHRVCGLFLCVALSIDRQQHFLLTGRGLARLLAFSRCLARDALLQGVHKVDNVLAPWPGLRTDRLAITFGIDEFGQSFFVNGPQNFSGSNVAAFWVTICFQVEHVLRNFHVLVSSKYSFSPRAS
jgi:hypothetical protein